MIHNETNIFKGAKFGDKYFFLNTIVIFIKKIKMNLTDGSEQLYELITPYGDTIVAYSNGFSYRRESDNTDLYVTKYHEEIDEEKLDELADAFENELYEKGNYYTNNVKYSPSDLEDAFKIGYRKAKEE